MKGPYSFERIRDWTSPCRFHLRVRDGQNNRIATCHSESNAEAIIELLNAGEVQWQAVTADAPPPLVEVMASVFNPGDEAAQVFMLYRRPSGEFCVAGTFDHLIRGVYAFNHQIMKPAPFPTAQQVSP